MKNIFIISIFFLSIGRGPSSNSHDIEEEIYPISINGKWGLENENGEVIVSPSLQHIKPFMHNLALAKQDGLYGFLNRKGEWEIKPKYNNAGDFYVDCSKVTYKDKEFYISKKGKRIDYKKCSEAKLIPGCFPGYKLEEIDSYILKKDSLFAIKYIQVNDTTGFIYESVKPFSSDFFVVEKDNKFGFFFRYIPRKYKGNVFHADTIETYPYDELVIPEPPKWQYDTSLYFGSHQYYKFRKGNYWGIINYLQKEITAAKYYSIKIEEGMDIFLVEFAPNKFGYINNRGKELFKRENWH